MTRVVIPILMLFLTGCSGITGPFDGPVPVELAPFQGKWDFDEVRFLDDRRASAKSAEEFGLFLKLYNEAKASGAGACPRIVVSGLTIVGEGATIEDRYDILAHHSEGKAIVGKAEYHEDRHDPGDSNVIEFVLEIDASSAGETLILRQGGKGAPPLFYKRARP